MDALAAVSAVSATVQLTHRIYSFSRLYRFQGAILFAFGSSTIWNLQAQVLARVDERSTSSFKRTILDECTMISVSAAIVAQISITAFSLNFLSQTHWVPRALFMLSLTFSLMAVYYASTQQRIMGRLLEPKQIRNWIRGYGVRYEVCDPDEWHPNSQPENSQYKRALLQSCFTPSVYAVITISAPQVLLSAALLSLLIAFGIYLGFIWTRELDTSAAPNGSRNVFIVYMTALGTSVFAYSLSSLGGEKAKSEYEVLYENMNLWLANHQEVVGSWISRPTTTVQE